VIIFKRRMES